MVAPAVFSPPERRCNVRRGWLLRGDAARACAGGRKKGRAPRPDATQPEDTHKVSTATSGLHGRGGRGGTHDVMQTWKAFILLHPSRFFLRSFAEP